MTGQSSYLFDYIILRKKLPTPAPLILSSKDSEQIAHTQNKQKNPIITTGVRRGP